MPIYCDNCGHQNRDSVKFCQGCGVVIIATTPNGYLKPGVILNKNYEIKNLLKQGGMGAVYLASNRKFATECAIKELLSQLGNPKDQQYMIDSFEREAKILHKLRYHNIPVVTDYFIEAGRYYLVMDYIDGKDLDTVMRNYPGGIVPENTVIKWAKEILDALDYLHSQIPPVIYRDMKPSNIMLRNSDNKIVLIDFGIAKIVNPDKQIQKTPIGTSGYAPIEQSRGKAEPRSDLYALGATMHHLLTGIEPLPFRFEPLRKINSKISTELESIVMKVLKDNLNERFCSAKEMKEALLSLSTPLQVVNKSQSVIVQTQIKQPSINYVQCPYCGIKNIDGNVFCDYCRRNLIQPSISQQINQIVPPTKDLYTAPIIQKSFTDHKDVETLGNKGDNSVNLGKYEEAIKCFDKALEITPVLERKISSIETRTKIRKTVLSGLFIALVFIFTSFIKIPTTTGGYTNPGDIIVIFAGFLFGGMRGLIIGGIGSSLSDLYGGYPAYILITLIVKGLEGLLAGYIGKDINRGEKFIFLLLGSILAGLWMVTGYFIGETIIFGPGVSVPPIIPNIIQAVVGIAGGLICYKVIGKKLKNKVNIL